MALPVETLNALIRGTGETGGITTCVACGCILYVKEDTAEHFRKAAAKKAKSAAGQASEL
jgi:hypothetical protein